MDHKHLAFMKEAISLSAESINENGGPFGAVIVKNGEVIGRGMNTVTKNNDPTAHAEINAIRDAARVLASFDLSGCQIYTSCEPCPMCLGAIYWARLEKIYYANNKHDARKIDFDDDFIYQEMNTPPGERAIPAIQMLKTGALEVFQAWKEKTDKIKY